MQSFQGEKWTQDKDAAERYGLRYIESRHGEGLCVESGRILTGSNSGHQALNLAFHLGAAEIALLGYDMQGEHFHGPHVAGLSNPNHSTLRRFAKALGAMAQDLERAGVRVTNCSRETALTCFERATIEEWRNECGSKEAA